jgi:hypothetical protein
MESSESAVEVPSLCNGGEIPELPSVLPRASKRKFGPPAPPDASAKSFVKWMQENGGVGDHLQGDLYDGYRFLLRASNLVPLKRNEFGRELKRGGCGRKEIDISDGGVRSKPYVISIPSVNETEAREAKEVSRVA